MRMKGVQVMTADPERRDPVHEAQEREADRGELRARAEAVIDGRRSALDPAARSGSPADQLAHDLAVLRVEVELQLDDLIKMREHLDRSVARYAQLYDFAPAGIVSIDAQGVVLRTNLAGARLLRADPASVVGRNVLDFIAPDDRAELSSFLAGAGAGSSHIGEIDLSVESEAPVTVAIDARRSNGGGGWELGFVDVSEVRAAQREIGELARLAERETIGRRLHDTVLQRLFGVSSSLQALLLNGELAPAAREVVERTAEELRLTVVEIYETVLRSDE